MKISRFFVAPVLMLCLLGCHKHHQDPVADTVATSPETTVPETPQSQVPTEPITQPVSTSAEDDAIIAAVLANGESRDVAPSASNERAAVFGNNFVGTPAQLDQCVRDAKCNVVNLVKVERFDPKNIRLFLNEKCTKKNYETWCTWAAADAKPGDRRVVLMNSSHGGEDVGPDGKVCDILITMDMISQNRWDETTEVSPQFWYNLLHACNCNFLVLNVSCHSGGQMRASLSLIAQKNHRKVRSIDGPPVVQARIDAAVERTSTRTLFANLSGTIFPVCQASELAEENEDGGAGTNAFWASRKSQPATVKSGDIARGANKNLKDHVFTQHFGLIGVNRPLFSKE